MKILVIRGCNIASLVGDFEIDFTAEPLASAGLFSISGVTGAGKSTILDTLCLALYGKTPRLDKADTGTKFIDVKDNEMSVSNPAVLLSKNTAFCKAEVDFIALDGNKYRSSWTLARAYNKVTGKAQNPKHSVYKLTEAAEIAISDSKTQSASLIVNDLVGLSFQQFTRSVLLAQGDFDAFLKAKDSDRGEILEKLTGTEIFAQISSRIYERTKQAEGELKILKLQLGEHEPLNEEQKAQIAQRIADLNSLSDTLNKEIKKYEDCDNWFVQSQSIDRQITEAEAALKEASSAIENSKDKKKLLADIEKISPVRIFVDDANKKGTEIKSVKEVISQIENQIKEANNQLAISENQKKEVENQLAAHNAKEPKLKSDLNKARELDTKIQLSSDNLIEADKARNGKKTDLDKLIESSKVESKKLDEIKADQQKRQSWLEQKYSYRFVVENISDITASVSQLEKDKSNFTDKTEKSQKLIKENLDLKAALEGNTAEFKRQTEALDQLNSKCESDKAECEKFGIDRLKELQISFDENRKALQKYEVAAANIRSLRDNSVTLQQNIENAEKILSEATQSLPLKKKQLEEQTVECAKLEGLYNALSTTNNEFVERLRAQLTDNHECPVCGAIHHPYSSIANEEFKKELKKISDQRDSDQNSCRKLSAEIAVLQNDIRKAEKEAGDAKAEKEKLNARCLKEEESLAGNVYVSAGLDYDKARIEELRLTMETENRALLDRIRQYDELKNKIQLSEKQIFNDNNVLLKLNTTIETQKVKSAANEKTIKENNENISQLQTSLNAHREKILSYFSECKISDDWDKNLQLFVERIRKFAEDWKENQSQLQLLQISSAQTEETVRQNALRLETANQDFTNSDNAYKDIQLRLNEEKKARCLYFEGVSAQEVESHFVRQREALNKTLNEKNNAYNDLRAGIDKLNGQWQTRKENLRQAEDAFAQLNLSVEQWVKDNLISLDEIRQLMKFDNDSVKQIKDELRKVDDNLVKAQTAIRLAMKNKETHLQNKPLEDVEWEMVKVQLVEKKTQRDEFIQEIATKSQILESDKELVRRCQDTQQKIELAEANYSHWNSLSSEIGSADGSKFRKIVQGYTLDILLETANSHISVIAPRYELNRIADSLAFEVIDKDMCDERRPVDTLSGGESFLVSLSLALGLSTFSSRNMNVESLFIDEGFGSLDEDSLCAVMDALEALHNQGRKVGVISHVSEMADRISTHIRVIKTNNGASRIEIG